MKLTIVHTAGARRGTRQSLAGKAVMKLGRRPDNDCVFDHESDSGVSGFHAEIRIHGSEAMIVDLGSTNGTYVNGRRVTQEKLDQHAEVKLGQNGPGFRIEYAAPTMEPTPGSSAAAGAPKNAPPSSAVTAELPSPKPSPEITAPLHTADLGQAASPQAAPTPAVRQAAPASPANPPAPKPAPQAAPKGESSEKIYGQRTVGLMIQQALDAAGTTKPKEKAGTSKSTEYFEALVEKKVKRSSSKLKWVVIIAVLLCVSAAAVVGVYLYLKPSQVIQTTQVNYGDAAGSAIAAANRYNVFLIAGVQKSGGTAPVGFCTGFAISADLLATNAHCVRAAQSKFKSVQAIMNGTSKRYTVTSMVAHAGYEDGKISPDVGLMKIKTTLSSWVTMADQSELSHVAPGAPMYLYGFPGRLNKEEAPEATFIEGDIGRITAFDQKLGDFGNNTLLQHSAYCTGGTSGSPMFNATGHVIGVNSGGYMENGQALAGYNFGMRIDLINELIKVLR